MIEDRASILLLACGSLRRELEQVVARLPWPVMVDYLPPDLHMSPEELARAIEAHLERTRRLYQRVVLVYGRCAPGLDELLERYGAERLPGEHCYEVLAGERFKPLLQEQPGTYFLTEFLCLNFDRVIRGLGLDRYPRLKTVYFRNYTRVVYLDTGASAESGVRAKEIAAYLDLPLSTIEVGVGGLERRLVQVLERTGSSKPPEPEEATLRRSV
ncbi:MAG: DUF1638 domain-containing protein [Dehalococcoidia bacterium]|nr:DUF1638 domain-containing protein [Dehalococcoidia bacterium]